MIPETIIGIIKVLVFKWYSINSIIIAWNINVSRNGPISTRKINDFRVEELFTISG